MRISEIFTNQFLWYSFAYTFVQADRKSFPIRGKLKLSKMQNWHGTRICASFMRGEVINFVHSRMTQFSIFCCVPNYALKNYC